MRHLSTRHAAERVGNGITRTIVEKVDDTKLMQHHTLSGYAGEQQQQIEHVHPYGFVSVVQKPSGQGQNRVGAEGFMTFMGGGRSSGSVVVAGDRRFRLYKLDAGEIALHDDQGQQVHFKRDGIWGSVPNSKKVILQVMDDDQMPQDSNATTVGGQKMGQIKQAGRPAQIKVTLDKNKFQIDHPNGAVTINCKSFNVNASDTITEKAANLVEIQSTGANVNLDASGLVHLKADSPVVTPFAVS